MTSLFDIIKGFIIDNMKILLTGEVRPSIFLCLNSLWNRTGKFISSLDFMRSLQGKERADWNLWLIEYELSFKRMDGCIIVKTEDGIARKGSSQN